MAGNGTVFLAALTSQAPSKSKVAISVRNVSALSAGVINRTPTMTPSEKPRAPTTEKKASDGDATTVIIIVVVVVVGGAVLLGVLLSLWFRFFYAKNSFEIQTTDNATSSIGDALNADSITLEVINIPNKEEEEVGV